MLVTFLFVKRNCVHQLSIILFFLGALESIANPDNSLYKLPYGPEETKAAEEKKTAEEKKETKKDDIKSEKSVEKEEPVGTDSEKEKLVSEYIVKNHKLYKTCESTKEFQEAYEFLLKDQELQLNQVQCAKKSVEIAKGCSGAAKRFKDLFTLLKKTGVDLGKSFEISLLFSQMSSERAESFKEIFQKAFLENYLNLDFLSAFKLTLEMSRDYAGDPIVLKNDFVKFVKFCTTDTEMSLNYKNCAELVVRMTKLTPLFKMGVYGEFESLYQYLRKTKRIGMSIKETLETIPKILEYGPRAPENFKTSMSYTLDKGRLQLSETQALKLALVLANLSLKEDQSRNPKEFQK